MRKFIPFTFMIALASCAGPGPIVPDTRTEKQMIGLLQKFDRWDLDGNGELSRKELTPAAKTSGKSITEILEYYDANKDGSISLREAQKGLEKKVDEHEGAHTGEE